MSTLRKVLVVDDDPVVGKSFDRVLSGKGYAVITAKDGPEALQKLASEDYDVVFTDIKMPGMNGIEVAQRLRAERPWLPVVIITGYGTAEHEAEARAAGVQSFLHKPLSPDLIEGSARAAIESAAETPALVAPQAPAEVTAKPAGAGKMRAVKNIALFFVAPFVALAYVIAFPFVGLAMLAWFAVKAAANNKAARKIGRVAKNIGLFMAAPFIALAYVIAFPFVGLVMLVWFGGKALKR